MIFALLAQPVWACGGLVTTSHSEQLAASDAQQAIIDVGPESVTVDYRIRYTGNAEDFAWIIPVPGSVAEVAEGSDERFESLASFTAPQVTWYEPVEDDGGSGGCGCILSSYGMNSKGGDALSDTGGGDGLDVSVLGSGYAGDFEYTVLDSESADDLSTWLTDRGYDLTYAEASIDAYVADPIGFQWIAVQLRPDVATTPEGGVSLKPLRIRYVAGDGGAVHALFPSRMSASTQVAEIRTELYVVGDSHATPGNGWTANVDYMAYGELEDDPEVVYADFLRQVGGTNRAMVSVYQGSWDEAGDTQFVTRFDAIVAPGTNTSDMVFTFDGYTDERSFRVLLGSYGYSLVFPFAAFGALGTAWGLRRRR